MIRCHHNLRALRLGAHDHAYGIFEPVVDAVRGLGYLVRGTGLYALIDVGSHVDEIVDKLAGEGLAARGFPNGMMALIPPFDLTPDDARHAIEALTKVLPTRVQSS